MGTAAPGCPAERKLGRQFQSERNRGPDTSVDTVVILRRRLWRRGTSATLPPANTPHKELPKSHPFLSFAFAPQSPTI